jgi:bacteriocin-like protein
VKACCFADSKKTPKLKEKFMSAKEISNNNSDAAREVTDQNQSVDTKELSDTELDNVAGGGCDET